MPLITTCKLYIGQNPTMMAYSLEHAHRMAIPYIDKRQPIKLEIGVASLPTQVWAFDYAANAWILQR